MNYAASGARVTLECFFWMAAFLLAFRGTGGTILRRLRVFGAAAPIKVETMSDTKAKKSARSARVPSRQIVASAGKNRGATRLFSRTYARIPAPI